MVIVEGSGLKKFRFTPELIINTNTVAEIFCFRQFRLESLSEYLCNCINLIKSSYFIDANQNRALVRKEEIYLF